VIIISTDRLHKHLKNALMIEIDALKKHV